MPKCCCVYSANASVAVCMAAYLYICYLSSATGLLEMLWLTLWNENHSLILENCIFFECMIIERCHPNAAVDLSRWGGMIGCLQLVYCTGGPMTFMFNVPQERRLQITVDGPIDLLTELNALQCCCNETHTLLTHVYIPLMLLLTDIRSWSCTRDKHEIVTSGRRIQKSPESLWTMLDLTTPSERIWSTLGPFFW